MASRMSATPLVAIDAVAVDTETTSLDTAKARIVQVGAVRLRRGRVIEAERFDELVDPGEPIPVGSTRVHGITDAAVGRARSFRDVGPDFAKFVGDQVVIGHSIGFDLAVWRAEAERAGIRWPAPPALDTRLLAEIANPRLPGFSLEIVTAWLGIEEQDRHSAIGDALMAARVFLALVPRLRERDIRTVAEAQAACAGLTAALEQQVRAGWIEPVRSRSGERSLARIDSYPYRHRVRDVMSAPPKVAADSLSVGEAARMMTESRISSLFIASAAALDGTAPHLADLGIVTERDVLRAIGRDGAAALTAPVGTISSRPLAAVPEGAYLYRAIGRMSRLGIRHLAVCDEGDRLVGALSQRDLLKMRAEEAISLGDALDCAEDAHELAAAWSTLPVVAASLVAEGVAPRDVAGVISRELGALTRRAGQLAGRRMREEGAGEPPCRYALLVLGSAGRGESLLSADQDNAIVFEDGEPGAEADTWFARYGEHVASILDEAGLPFCKGGVMARNPAWRGSIATWRRRIAGWVRDSKPADLLAVDIFFDQRPVHGDASLGQDLFLEAYALASEAPDFAKLLAEVGGDHKPPLTFLGGIKTEEGRVDLKRGALLPIVSAARLLSIRHRIPVRSTAERLARLTDRGIGSATDLARLDEGHALVLGLVLAQQLDDVEHGVPVSSRVALKRLTRAEHAALKAALGHLESLPDAIRDLLFR